MSESKPTLKPYGHGDPLMEMFFSECVMWVWDNPEMQAQFTAQTGLSLPPAPTNGLAAMIDQATGIREKVMTAFIEWVIEYVWGKSPAAAASNPWEGKAVSKVTMQVVKLLSTPVEQTQWRDLGEVRAWANTWGFKCRVVKGRLLVDNTRDGMRYAYAAKRGKP